MTIFLIYNHFKEPKNKQLRIKRTLYILPLLMEIGLIIRLERPSAQHISDVQWLLFQVSSIRYCVFVTK